VKPNVNRPAYVIAFAGLVSAAFTAAIMSLHAATAPAVERNEKLFRQRALVEVFGLDVDGEPGDAQVRAVYDRQIRPGPTVTGPQTGTTFALMEAVDSDGKLLGYALPIWGVGFWARIEGYLAVTPDLRRVVGITFLDHAETPGLGGRITERPWRRRFEGLDVTAPRAGGRYVYIGGEKGALAEGRYVDAITGATGTCSALQRFLNARLAEFRRAAETIEK
jgi:Na+-transporting NADH:ubiquinone oxidoreductase subunit C